MITPQNILYHELIGVEISVDESCGFGNISGRIIHETRNTIVARTASGIKTLPKNALKKIAIRGDGGCFIKGVSLIGRPEDRISRSN